jgi:putative membrane-bound dehydrogenase-like protein
VPPPPPHHDRGADRISIHEDRDRNGTYETHKVFVDGLNIVTAIARGRGGVWVLNPPYLLFYPDADHDDVPDGDPVVHLAGFGIEDTHACANSLCWGPDGWLWGAQGSGVTAKIRRPGIDPDGGGFAFQGQAIWRYHPERRVFELFAEGGGNTFSLVLDSQGQVFSGTNASGTRGNHYNQGGFHSKNWGEHGYLTNPYAFGHFTSMPHNWKAPHLTHTMTYYEEGRMGAAIENHFVAPNVMRNRIELSERLPNGSSYQTKDVATFLETDDRWFRPVDIKAGPDGALYVADWSDIRIAHADPRDDWDRERGRVYRIGPTDLSPVPAFDLAARSTADLVTTLDSRQYWMRQTALRLLADRKDRSAIAKLVEKASSPSNPYAIDALEGLYVVGGFSPDLAVRFLDHPQPAVRGMAIRFIGDRDQPRRPDLASTLTKLAKAESDSHVRAQLASTARRLPATIALDVLFRLMARTDDLNDPRIPLLTWWGLEHFAETQRAAIVQAFSGTGLLDTPFVLKHIAARLAQRYASIPSAENQEALAKIGQGASAAALAQLRQGIAAAFEGRGIAKLSPEMEKAFFNPQSREFTDPLQMSLAIRQANPAAILTALGFVVREEPPLETDRIKIIQALADAKAESALPVLMEVLARSRSRAVREAALGAIGRFDDPQLVKKLLRLWSSFDAAMRERALLLLVSRQSWARELLSLVHRSEPIPKSDITATIIQSARLLGDPEINQIADKYYGQQKAHTTADKQRRIDEIAAIVAGGSGKAVTGAKVFDARCASCHQLFGHGGTLGPDLTGKERGNLPNMLLNIIDPNASIREGYTLFQLKTRDDRTLMGFIDERDPARIVLRDVAGQRTSVLTANIAEERALPTSLMPEGLLEGLTDQELRDFFAYLASPAPAASKTNSR